MAIKNFNHSQNDDLIDHYGNHTMRMEDIHSFEALAKYNGRLKIQCIEKNPISS